MNLILSTHAIDRMRERRVSLEDIERALKNYHTSNPGRRGGIVYTGPGLSGHDLKVWVTPPGITEWGATITIRSVAWRD